MTDTPRHDDADDGAPRTPEGTADGSQGVPGTDRATNDGAQPTTPYPADQGVTYGAPPLPGSTPRAGEFESGPDGRRNDDSQPRPGSFPHPSSHQQAGPYQQPGSYQQTGSYQQSGDPQQPGPYQQPGSYQQPSSYQQPGSYQQPSSYQQAGTDPYRQPDSDPSAFAYDTTNSYAAAGWRAPAEKPKKSRRGAGSVAAALLVGVLVGGAAGGGVAAVLSRDSGAGVSATGQSRDLTVNDYDDATVVTAVAAKATKSVVTINVTAGESGGTGSGVILSDDGYIVTNTHVVTLDGASASGSVTVTLSDGSILPAEVVGLDPTVDLAVLKVDAPGLTPIDFADSSELNVGDTAVAIGAPLGLSNTVTDGIVSTLNRSITVQSSAAPTDGSDQGQQNDNNGQGPFSFNNGDGGTQNQASSVISLPVIQTDASINPGNSGGALLDSQGELIGLNVAIASSGESSGSIGVGFSVPSNLVQRVAKEIMANGKASHGLLGASVNDATSDAAATRVGALIVQLSPGGAAQNAGLRQGDVVTEFNGVPISDRTDLTAQVRFLAGGATADLTYVRDGKTDTTKVTLDTLTS
ncbi:trypsin-like peptidase domain-containing protein [Frigoribacterium sp. CFBP 8759]|uniref:S1C family serine protease n=1 Tax=Frigoribacterium sp. CFBP 8759 TaxID=2775283 RepID=UPI001782AC6E|nr:trypsin-like peptidase domain-containing protein [Frigoribacterium sp. CFBP 8759]MBD8484270.1 trypsin-like peptidase domain-containing protein [Frigoribacterium sp. CFBP 8759]